ncbi:MAG: aldolase/citrate lyase family protein [Geminicoccaceae bacterium]
MAWGKLKALTREGNLKLGHYVGEFVTPGIGYMLKEAGCAYCFLDMEHSGMSFDTLARVLRYMEAADLPCMVRVPSHAYDHIARALDLGAEGIVIPMLGTAKEAKSVIRSMKYTPRGARGVAPGLGNDLYRMRPVLDMFADSNDQTVFIALIETAAGIENVDKIAALDEVDCLWVGHFDLTCSMGIPGSFDDIRFIDAMARVNKAGKKNGKALGRLVGNTDEGVTLADQGWDFICYSGDVWLYQTALRQGLDAIRDGAGARKAAKGKRGRGK